MKNNILGCKIIYDPTNYDGCSVILANHSIESHEDALDFALDSMGYDYETDSIFLYTTRIGMITVPHSDKWGIADHSFLGHKDIRELQVRVKSDIRDVMMVIPIARIIDGDFTIIGGIFEKCEQ